MIERLIYKALERGITEATADPERILVYFRDLVDLDEAEALKIRDYFLEKPPTIVHNYPRTDAKFPLYAIVLGNEHESHRFLDDTGGFISLEEAETFGDPGLAGTDTKSSIFQHTYHVIVHSEGNPDVAVWYYELAKFFIFRERDYLKENGVLVLALSGSDLMPATEYGPDWIFRRQLTLTAESTMLVYEDQAPIIREIRGIQVDDGSGSVDAHVTPYIEGQD